MLAKGNSSVDACSRCLLSTMQREVPYARTKGIDPDVMDMSFGEVEGYLDETARECLDAYEPRINVESLELEFGESDDGGDMAYTVSIVDGTGEDEGD